MKKVVFAAAAATLALTGSALAANQNSSCESQVNAKFKQAFGTPGQNEITVKGKNGPITTSLPANEFAASRNEFREAICTDEKAELPKLPN